MEKDFVKKFLQVQGSTPCSCFKNKKSKLWINLQIERVYMENRTFCSGGKGMGNDRLTRLAYYQKTYLTRLQKPEKSLVSFYCNRKVVGDKELSNFK